MPIQQQSREEGACSLTPTNSENAASTSIVGELNAYYKSTKSTNSSYIHRRRFYGFRQLNPALLQIAFLCSLGLVALIARITLADQLDLVTDEIIYILAGKSYMPLLKHITTSPWACPDCWQVNYEHPPLVKLLIGISLLLNNHAGYPLSELQAARIPSIIAGTALIMAIYWLGRKPFGQVVAFLAALSLAISPWLVYFSSIAYLDMTMTMFITIAYLLTWHATRRPWLYLCVALCVGLGIDSKYTAALIIPGIVLFTAYYFFVLRLSIPSSHRPSIPWLWWLIAGILTPLCFLALDPVIWSNPLHLLVHSAFYEWKHSIGGHLTFLAGSYSLYVPHWTVLYIVINKISATATVPAAIFAVMALTQLTRFHLRARRVRENYVKAATTLAFLLIWLLATFAMFSLLNIVVGTHYLLPLAPPVVITGVYTLTSLGRYSTSKIGSSLLRQGRGDQQNRPQHVETGQAQGPVPTTPVREEVAHADQTGNGIPSPSPSRQRQAQSLRFTWWRRRPKDLPGIAYRSQFSLQSVSILVVTGVIIVGPHLLGLLNTPDAEGYTSEFFHGENQTLQVAYPGYREAVQWLATHTQGDKRIGLVALPETLLRDDPNVSWFAYNNNLPKRFKIREAHPKDTSYPYDYLVWPMHLIQRGYSLPPVWNKHIIHAITGGDTIYCYIAAIPPP